MMPLIAAHDELDLSSAPKPSSLPVPAFSTSLRRGRVLGSRVSLRRILISAYMFEAHCNSIAGLSSDKCETSGRGRDSRSKNGPLPLKFQSNCIQWIDVLHWIAAQNHRLRSVDMRDAVDSTVISCLAAEASSTVTEKEDSASY